MLSGREAPGIHFAGMENPSYHAEIQDLIKIRYQPFIDLKIYEAVPQRANRTKEE